MANPDSRSPPIQNGAGESGDGTDEAGLSPFLLAITLLALVSPIPFASNGLGPISFLLVTIGTVLGAYVWHRTTSDRWTDKTLSAPLVLALGAYACVCLWALVQALLPIPPGWAEPAWTLAQDLLEEPLTPRFSVDPAESVLGVARLASYGVTFYLAASLSRSALSADLVYRAAIILGGVLAAYALVVFFVFDNEWILYRRKFTLRPDLTGTYVGRNQAAAFFGLIAIVVVARLLSDITVLSKNADSFSITFSRFMQTIGTRRKLEFVVLPLLLLALLLTHSRWAQATFFVTLTAMVLLIPYNASTRRGRNTALGLWVWLALPLIMGGAMAFVWTNERFQAIDDVLYNARWATFDLVLYRIGLSPLAGTGLGTFENIFTSLEGAEFARERVLNAVHNTYLENTLELGIPAALLLFAAIALVVAFTLTRRWRRRWPEPFFVVLGASLFLGLHQLLDFSLHSPSIALLFALLLGVSAGRWRARKRLRRSSVSRETEKASAEATDSRAAPVAALLAPALGACAFFLIAVGLWTGWQVYRDSTERATIAGALEAPDVTGAELTALGKDFSTDGDRVPAYAWAYFNRAWTQAAIADSDRLSRRQRSELGALAVVEQRRAVMSSPANAEYWAMLAIFSLRAGDPDNALDYLAQSYLLGRYDRRSRIERLWVYYNLPESRIDPEMRQWALSELNHLYYDQPKWLIWQLVGAIPDRARPRLRDDADEIGIDFSMANSFRGVGTRRQHIEGSR